MLRLKRFGRFCCMQYKNIPKLVCFAGVFMYYRNIYGYCTVKMEKNGGMNGMKRLCLIVLSLLMMHCMTFSVSAAEYAPFELTDGQRAAANLFLSNFTETGIKNYDAYEDIFLTDFAIDHMWFNGRDAFELGEYMGGYNYRVADDNIQSVLEEYFYYPREADLSQTRFDYSDGYYYFCDTGGTLPCGFAYTVSACQIEEGKYFVAFMVFGGGDAWENDVMDMTLDEIEELYGHPTGYGSAIIYADDLSDRSTYRMISFGKV